MTTEQRKQALSQAPKLAKLQIPWWMDGETLTQTTTEPAFMKRGLQTFWQRLREWCLYPLKQMDPFTCSVATLNLLAWERGITRFNGEPLWLYRKRVAYAPINAREAGGAQGFINIMRRLDLNVINATERSADLEWDVISIEIDDSNLENTDLVNVIIQDYGRTCRRYNTISSRAAVMMLPVTEFNNDFQTLTARAE